MNGDPEWAVDAALSTADMWKRRATHQLERARDAEATVKELEKRVYELEGDIVLAVGATAEDALKAFCAKQWPGEDVSNVSVLDGRLDWGFRCYVGGTGMKIGGNVVPGGHTVTWWK